MTTARPTPAAVSRPGPPARAEAVTVLAGALVTILLSEGKSGRPGPHLSQLSTDMPRKVRMGAQVSDKTAR